MGKIYGHASKSYVMISGRLYHLGQDNILQLCLIPEEYDTYLQEAHTKMSSLHCSNQQTYQRLERLGVYWSDMKQDVNSFVNNCDICRVKPHVTK